MAAIGVIGAGAWGTALAVLAARRGHEVVLWARRAALAEEIAAARENADYLPGVRLADSIRATADGDALAACGTVLVVVPAQHVGAVLAGLAPAIRADALVVLCAKGIERASGRLMSAVAEAALPGRTMAVLTGPGFAAEVAQGLPTAVTVACADRTAGEALVEALGDSAFRPYLTDDVIGAQVGGAVKNVLAIACGICAGRGYGDSARAALITRGLAEIGRLAAALGGRPETLQGLSGLGDVVLTCTSAQSRNYALGLALGEGRPLAELLAGRRTVVEGEASAAAVAALAEAHGVEMPITAAVDAVLHRGAALDATVRGLLTRPFRAEAGAR